MLLTPRDYLSTFMKITIIGFLVIGVLFVNPQLQMPAISQYAGGAVRLFRVRSSHSVHHDRLRRHFGLPWPDLVWHEPKMVDKEPTSVRSATGQCSARASSALWRSSPPRRFTRGDYFAINTPPAVFQTLRDSAGAPLAMVNLADLQVQVGENVVGRPGGARVARRRDG